MEIADNSIDLLGIVFIELKDLTAKKIQELERRKVAEPRNNYIPF